MYEPAHFSETRPEVLQALMRDHPLATLAWLGPDGIQADLIPLRCETGPEGALRLCGHVARANPLWREYDPAAPVLAVFQGPQGYISPSWYPSKQVHGKVVPTWNYIVVQARGTLRVHDDSAWLHALVTRLTDQHEARFEQAWAVRDAPADYIAGMTRAIVGIELVVSHLVGKWKLSQNRAPEDRAGVVAGLRQLGQAEANTLAERVRAQDPDQPP